MKLARYFAIAVLVAVAGQAQAIPIEPTDIVRIDFDLSAETPAPPYSDFNFFFYFGPTDLLDPDEGFRLSLFDAEGDPALYSSVFNNSFGQSTDGLIIAVWNVGSPLTDGIGYLLLTDIVGTFDLIESKALAFVDGDHTNQVQGVISVSTIPEPTAALVFGIGALMVATSVRRRG